MSVATGFCNAFGPRRYIYAVAKDVMRLNNYVADIDAHTESNPPVFVAVVLAGCKAVRTRNRRTSSTRPGSMPCRPRRLQDALLGGGRRALSGKAFAVRAARAMNVTGRKIVS
jgi:hypothetical protein